MFALPLPTKPLLTGLGGSLGLVPEICFEGLRSISLRTCKQPGWSQV